MAFIKDTSLKIEDILPFFPDFVVIDDFKDEICLALEEYTKDIDRLRTEMVEATKSAEAIKKDIANLNNRFVTLEPGERCSHCSYPLFTRQFYVFPCQHTFHADCLIGMVCIISLGPKLLNSGTNGCFIGQGISSRPRSSEDPSLTGRTCAECGKRSCTKWNERVCQPAKQASRTAASDYPTDSPFLAVYRATQRTSIVHHC